MFQVVVTRTSTASPPIGGTFDLSFENDQFEPILGIPADISRDDFGKLANNVEGLNKVWTYRWGSCTGFVIKLVLTRTNVLV